MSDARDPVTLNKVLLQLDNVELLLRDMEAYDADRVSDDPDELRRKVADKLQDARDDIERLEEMVQDAGVHVVTGGRDFDHCPFCGWNEGDSWKRHASAAHPDDYEKWKRENGEN